MTRPAEPAGNRDEKGRFGTGNTANPGGRPPMPPEVKQAFAEMTPRAMARLSLLIDSDDEKVALAAVREVLDRRFGKATQPVDLAPESMDDETLKRAVIEIADQWKTEGAMQ